MLKLRPYKECDAETITGWPENVYEFNMWVADRYESYPICADDMNAYYAKDKMKDTIWAMTAFDGDGVAGHFTMRYADEAGKILRLGCVIVDRARRGQGLGKAMLTMAARYAFEFVDADKLTLGVFEENPEAVGCYEAVGFRIVPLPQKKLFHLLGKDWNCLEMELDREEFYVRQKRLEKFCGQK